MKSVLYGGMTRVPTTQVKTHQYFGGGERKTTDQAEGKRFIDYGLGIRRGEGWLPGTQ